MIMNTLQWFLVGSLMVLSYVPFALTNECVWRNLGAYRAPFMIACGGHRAAVQLCTAQALPPPDIPPPTPPLSRVGDSPQAAQLMQAPI